MAVDALIVLLFVELLLLLIFSGNVTGDERLSVRIHFRKKLRKALLHSVIQPEVSITNKDKDTLP